MLVNLFFVLSYLNLYFRHSTISVNLIFDRFTLWCSSTVGLSAAPAKC